MLAFSPLEISILGAIGLAAGVLGGLLGIGGGLVMIPCLVLLLGDSWRGPASFHLYKLASLLTAIALSLPAVWQHFHVRAVVVGTLWSIIPFGVIGTFAGVWLAGELAGDSSIRLRQVFGAFMLVTVAVNAWNRRKSTGAGGSDRCPLPSRWTLYGTLVGLPAGVIAGLLGVGGGIWAVPVQHYLLGIRVQCAIANSACAIVAIAAAAALVLSNWLGTQPGVSAVDGWLLAACLAPGAVGGGLLGAWLTHRIPTRGLRVVFDGILVITGLRLIWP